MRADLHSRLEALDQAEVLSDVNLPGFGLHPLRGRPGRYSLYVNGPWRITFEWDDGEAFSGWPWSSIT